jgi:hypothetical protein
MPPNPPNLEVTKTPLKNKSNTPRYGIELGQFPKNTIIEYWITAYDTAKNTHISPTSSITVT